MSRRTQTSGPLNSGGGGGSLIDFVINPSKKKQPIPLTINNVLLGCLAIGVVLVIAHYLLDPFHLPDSAITAFNDRQTNLPSDFMELISPAKKPLWPPKPIKVPTLDPERLGAIDKEWLQALRTRQLVAMEPFDKGYSDKFRVAFEGGYLAVCKPSISIEEAKGEISFDTVDMYKEVETKNWGGQRSGFHDRRLTQGWAEVVSFHVDRLLGLGYKPPITGRYISNHDLFAFNDTDPVFCDLRTHQPTFFVPVALIPWLDDLKSVVPSYHEIGAVLLMRKDLPSPPVSRFTPFQKESTALEPTQYDHLEQIRRVSNIISFDYILDDHDRKNVQNWKQSSKLFITWDSGLSWIHGPDGSKSSDESLLCGPERWRIAVDGWNDTDCQTICRFSRTFYFRVQELMESKDPSERFGLKLKERLLDDPMFPIFHQALFYKNKRDRKPKQKTHFEIDNFWTGIERKTSRFLDHVQGCIDQYGFDQVLI